MAAFPPINATTYTTSNASTAITATTATYDNWNYSYEITSNYSNYPNHNEPIEEVEEDEVQKRKSKHLAWTKEKEREYKTLMMASRPYKKFKAQRRRKPIKAKGYKNRVCRKESRFRVLEK